MTPHSQTQTKRPPKTTKLTPLALTTAGITAPLATIGYNAAISHFQPTSPFLQQDSTSAAFNILCSVVTPLIALSYAAFTYGQFTKSRGGLGLGLLLGIAGAAVTIGLAKVAIQTLGASSVPSAHSAPLHLHP